MELTHYNLDAFNALLRLHREGLINYRAVTLGQVIASFANRDTGEAWPSRATLAAITGISPRHVSGTIRELEQVGFLVAVGREGQSNIYRLTLDQDGTPADSAPLTKTAGTLDCFGSKPLTETAPITIEEQSKNNEVSQNNEKPPRRSAHHPNENDAPTSKDKPKGKSFPQGNQTPSLSLPRTADVGLKESSPAKVVWDGQHLIAPDALLESWRDAYPCVDLDMAIKRASSWCLSNPGKRPKKNFSKFLNGWLGRVRPDSPEYIDLGSV